MAKATKKTAATEENNTLLSVEIPEVKINTMHVRIVGTAPLIMHAWSWKAKQMILDKQLKKASSGKAAKDPFGDFVESMYWISGQPDISEFSDEVKKLAFAGVPINIEQFADAKFGFPTTAFKSSAINAGYQQEILGKKTTAQGAIHMVGEFAVIEGFPNMRDDMVRIGKGVADIRFRAEFKEWRTMLTVRYNAQVLSPEQIVNLLNYGGFANGVGEWRPEKRGNNGTFTVEIGG